ncbi:MAG: hypothetical protein JRH20_31180 [Deltaproteobacteria bacterium]|nr:hypothetical protein [Deltaproteobacteria bacterium]
MPIRKLRDLREAEEATWCDPEDPRLVHRIRAVWQLAALLAPKRYPPGVYKYRSIAEASEQAARWEKAPHPG